MAGERVQRRLAAIMAADVVGYSRLMREDEEGTLAELTACRIELIEPSISDHGGRVIKTTGDGFLVEFSSAVDAVRCAIELQDGLAAHRATTSEGAGILFRIGINLGDVIVQDNDVFGDGVNVAARLEGLAKPGGIMISASVHEQVRDKLRVDFEDLGEQRVKNIDRPIQAYSVGASIAQHGSGKSWQWSLPVRARRAAIALVAALAIAAGAAALWLLIWPPAVQMTPTARVGSGPDRASLAVLPFKNLGGGDDQQYFADGIAEDIIDALGRYKSLTVMAYNATRPYKDQPVKPTEIAHTLGVRYFVEGSVRRAGPRLRVSARLTDANRGALLWSEQFDEESTDVFVVQDRITQRIAGTLIASLTRVEQQRAFAKPTENLNAYDLVLRGRAQLARASRSGNREARRLFQQAIEADPKFAAAYAWMARAHYQQATDGWTEFPGDALARSEDFALNALSIDPELVEALRTLSRVHAIQFQLDRAIAEIEQAIAVNPSDAEAHADRGVILLWVGRLEEAATALEIAFAYDPNLRSDYVFALGLAYYSLRRHEDAIKILEAGAARFKDYVFIPAVLAAAYGQLGRDPDARRNAKKVMTLLPIFDPNMFGARFQSPEHFEYLTDGLRKAGLM